MDGGCLIFNGNKLFSQSASIWYRYDSAILNAFLLLIFENGIVAMYCPLINFYKV